MLKTNAEKLIKISVTGEIASPTLRNVYNVSATGKAQVLPGVGGITYNLRVGDPAVGWEADHVEQRQILRLMCFHVLGTKLS
jgi:hypothetical protein